MTRHRNPPRNQVTRFGVSIEPELLRRFDRLVARSGGANRSEVVRDLVRRHLDETRLRDGSAEAIGTVTIVYDHEKHDLAQRLTRLQHDHHAAIVTNVHVHLDRHDCLEVLIVRGPARRVRRLADELIATRGVRHGRLALTTARD